MGKFATLFEINEDQLLVKLEKNDDDYPQVVCITEIDNMEMSIAVIFEPKTTKESFSNLWSIAEKYLKSFNQIKAEDVRKGMVNGYYNLS